jgi:hypothetical protein
MEPQKLLLKLWYTKGVRDGSCSRETKFSHSRNVKFCAMRKWTQPDPIGSLRVTLRQTGATLRR